VIEHEERCGENGDKDCPICSDRMSPAFIETVRQAAAQPGQVMTGDEFKAWLDVQAASAL
tara:strand:+ start:2955 stop:3134 length:180 start_codon:yes stop_codon:yes gene_type:complete